MARVVTELRCSSKPTARHTAATEGRPRARATDLAQSAVHFAHIGPFSVIFSEVDCVFGQKTGDNTAPTTKPGHRLVQESPLWRHKPLPRFFADHPPLRVIAHDLALPFCR